MDDRRWSSPRGELHRKSGKVRDQKEVVLPLPTVRAPDMVMQGDAPVWPLPRPAFTSKMPAGRQSTLPGVQW
jgi:hypothetical protein